MKKKLDIKKLVLLNLPYVFAFYFVDKLAAVFRLAPGTEFIDKLTGGFANFGAAFANPLPSFHPVDLLIGVAGGALLKLAVYIKGKNRKKFRQGEEYGSARWGRPEDIRPYMDDDFSNNVILTQTEGLTMNSRPKQPKYARNKNILVIGIEVKTSTPIINISITCLRMYLSSLFIFFRLYIIFLIKSFISSKILYQKGGNRQSKIQNYFTSLRNFTK